MAYADFKVGDKLNLTGYLWPMWKAQGMETDEPHTIATIRPDGDLDGAVRVTFEEFSRDEGAEFVLSERMNALLPGWEVELV